MAYPSHEKRLHEGYDWLLRISHVFEDVPFAVAVFKGESLIIEFINKHNLEIWGKSKDEVLGRPLFEVRPDIRSVAETIHAEIYRTGQRFMANEIPVELNTNGKKTLRYFNTVIDPIFDDFGNITGQLATSIEITEQVLARKIVEEKEQSLRAITEQLELTIQNVPAAVYLLDATGKILYANKPGYDTVKSVLGQDYNSTEDLSMLMEKAQLNVEYRDENDKLIEAEQFPLAKAIAFGEVAEMLIKRVYKKTGKVNWFLNRSTPLMDESKNVKYILSTSTDLTIQKEIEEKIKDSEIKFRTLAEALPQMVWIRNMQGQIEFGSRHWFEYSGIDNVSDAWKFMVHPDDWCGVMQTWEKHFDTGERMQYEVRLRNKYDEYRWHYAVAEPVKDSSGTVVKWIGAVIDVHNQKTFSERLEHLVTQRTLELERSNNDLQQFAHVASHDLKEPVRKVSVYANRLRSEFGDILPAKALVHIEKIEKAAMRMSSMVDGVLKYSYIDSAQEVNEVVDLTTLLQNIHEDFELLIHEKSASIIIHPLPHVMGSHVLLSRLFYNVINNSLKFSKSEVPAVIEVSGECIDKVVRIHVVDNGIGFNQSDSEHIFQPFIRLNAKDKYEGTGLGLALCKKICERIGGSISATSIKGVGTNIEIVLPVQSNLEKTDSEFPL